MFQKVNYQLGSQKGTVKAYKAIHEKKNIDLYLCNVSLMQKKTLSKNLNSIELDF